MADVFDRLKAALADRYAIERELGSGGMATVYLAEDLKHLRHVALKVLRPELAAVLGADRFVQEITTTANLQHPHILPLFDSGEANGFLYYVMPFIDGETLRDKLNRETQLGIDEAVRITTDIADALDYAHRHNVIHRDIKPENVLLHDGRPTVADFGIALAVSAAAGGRMTETGMSLGTPHYMSPEQATAEKDLTNRSDIYSLGAVLYELLTGEPPHMGNSAQQIIMKIVTDEARPVTDLRKSVPPHVAGATAKALEKLPADRYGSAAEFAAALNNPAFSAPMAGAVPLAESAKGWPWKYVSLVTSALALLFLGTAIWAISRPEPRKPVTRLSVRIPDDQNLSGPGAFDISPDGLVMVYEGRSEVGQQLWARRWDALDATPIRNTQGGGQPAVSPAGAEVASITGGSIRVVPLSGGVARTLANDSAQCCVRWGPDAVWLYFTNFASGLSRVPAAGGPIETLTHSAAGEEYHLFGDVLPNGESAVFSSLYTGGDGRIMALDIKSKQLKELTPGSFPRYSTGYLLFVTTGGAPTLMAAPFDPDRLELRGPAVPLAEGLRPPWNFWQYFAVSQTGRLLYTAGVGASASYEIVSVSREGQLQPVDPAWTFDPGDNNRGLSLSPDGRRLAITTFTESNYDIYLKELPEGPATRLTFDPAFD
ncbi:protein kinase, partial [Gemmatimonadota bacterium]